MEWIKGRLKEKECLKWFKPSFIKGEIKDSDWELFFKKSERGIEPEIRTEGYKILNGCKKWRDIQLNMWEEGILDGNVPYFTLLGGEDEKEIPPREVVDFIKKDIFGGLDTEIIEKLYEKINTK